MHDTGMPHDHDDMEQGDQNTAPTPDPRADHDTNHRKEKVEGCEFC